MPKAQRKTPQRTKGQQRLRAEAPASRGAVVAETVLATFLAGVLGAVLVFVLNLVFMFVLAIAFRSLPSYPFLNGIGLGVLMSSGLAFAAFGLPAVYAMVPARLALARMYVGLARDSRALGDTVEVRGRVDLSPHFPAMVATAVIGSIAVLGAIVCAALLPEASRDPGSPELLRWSVGLWVSLGVVFVCVAGVFVFRVLDRRWAVLVKPLVPQGAFGPYGKPTMSVGREEEKHLLKAERRSYSFLDWCHYAAGAAATAGLIGSFVSMLARHPQRYGPDAFYAAPAEDALHGLSIVSGALFFAGLIAALVTGGFSVSRALLLAGRVGGGRYATVRDGQISRTAPKRLADTSTFLLAVWFAVPILLACGYCARDVLPAMNGRPVDSEAYPFLDFDALPTAFVWLGGLALLVALRAAIEARLPDIRNRVGYELPIEGPEGPDINFR